MNPNPQQQQQQPQQFHDPLQLPSVTSSPLDLDDAMADIFRKKLVKLTKEHTLLLDNPDSKPEFAEKRQLYDQEAKRLIAHSQEWGAKYLRMYSQEMKRLVDKVDAMYQTESENLANAMTTRLEQLPNQTKPIDQTSIPWKGGMIGYLLKQKQAQSSVSVSLPGEEEEEDAEPTIKTRQSKIATRSRTSRSRTKTPTSSTSTSNRKAQSKYSTFGNRDISAPNYSISQTDINSIFKRMEELDSAFYESQRRNRAEEALRRGYRTSVDVYQDPVSGYLIYNDQEFPEGCRVYIIEHDRAWLGTIVKIDSAAIQIKYQDGTKSRLFLDKLRAKIYSIRTAQFE